MMMYYVSGYFIEKRRIMAVLSDIFSDMSNNFVYLYKMKFMTINKYVYMYSYRV